VLLFAPRKPASFLLERATIAKGGYSWGFALGLLQAQWTFTGYDASAHVTEETHDPRLNAPRGIMTAVIASGLAGYAMLLAVTLAISDLGQTVQKENPFIYILTNALGERRGGALLWLCMGAMWFCGLSSVTSNSRMLFAFARDGGTPGSTYLARVSSRFQTPHIAVWISAIGAFAVAAWADALSAMTALSTIALYASYAAPILLALLARRAGRFKTRGPWNLGRCSNALNAIAIGWVAIVMVLFVLPPNQLAGYTFAGCLAVLAVYWFAVMKKSFRGPPLTLE
jgi:amino acid transporter